MNRGQVIALIGKRLGNRTDLGADILIEMDLAQATALERNGRIVPWFLETEIASAPTTPGDERLPIPTDFAMEKETGGLFIYDASLGTEPWVKLTKDDYDALLAEFQDQQTRPKKYSLGGQYFRLKPTPDAVYTVKQIYFATVTAPSLLANDNTDNLWLRYAPDLMIAVVAKVMAEKYLQDRELGASFDGDITRAWDRLNSETEAQQHTNREYVMGDLD